jgi:hypothetical protein
MTNAQRLLELALKGLEAERANIDDEIAQIKAQLNGGKAIRPAEVESKASVAAPAKKRRTMSAEAKRRISEGMKRRYAALRKAVAKK